MVSRQELDLCGGWRQICYNCHVHCRHEKQDSLTRCLSGELLSHRLQVMIATSNVIPAHVFTDTERMSCCVAGVWW